MSSVAQAVEEFKERHSLPINPIYMSCVCNKCGRNSLAVIKHGKRGYKVVRVDSNCKHIIEQKEV